LVRPSRRKHDIAAVGLACVVTHSARMLASRFFRAFESCSIMLE
jgi:hypothetical protein